MEKYLELMRSVVLDLEWIGGRRSPGSCHCSGNSHIWSNPPPHKYQGQNFYDAYTQDEEEQKSLKMCVDVRLFREGPLEALKVLKKLLEVDVLGNLSINLASNALK